MYLVKSIGLFLQSESSTIREQLLIDYIPDDVCPPGAQLFMDTPKGMYQADSSSISKEVINFG